jgi:hypothetical protein
MTIDRTSSNDHRLSCEESPTTQAKYDPRRQKRRSRPKGQKLPALESDLLGSDDPPPSDASDDFSIASDESEKASTVAVERSLTEAAIENAEEFRDPLDNLVERAALDHSVAYKAEVVKRLWELKQEEMGAFVSLRQRLEECGRNMKLLDEAIRDVASEKKTRGTQPREVLGDERGLPEIRIRGGNLPSEIDEAEQALITADTGLYQRGSTVVRTAQTKMEGAHGRKIVGTRLVLVTPRNLAETMTRVARWYRYNPQTYQDHRTNAPLNIAQTYLDRDGQRKLPILVGIINCLTLRRDGSILDTPGFDEETGLLFIPGNESFPAIAQNPTRQDAVRALELLKKLISTFPFVSDADRSVALSAILTASIRRSLLTAPLHGFTAPSAGTGKSMLVETTSLISSGWPAGVIAPG